ncbi:MMB_0454 family protein [Mycoplasmopsis synoviae]|uniref:MMB_0454 family protein n=1 Tax=Mycoplasmopsis synoviae TaxID=2109 RepID=UPI003563C3F4
MNQIKLSINNSNYAFIKENAILQVIQSVIFKMNQKLSLASAIELNFEEDNENLSINLYLKLNIEKFNLADIMQELTNRINERVKALIGKFPKNLSVSVLEINHV